MNCKKCRSRDLVFTESNRKGHTKLKLILLGFAILFFCFMGYNKIGIYAGIIASIIIAVMLGIHIFDKVNGKKMATKVICRKCGNISWIK